MNLVELKKHVEKQIAKSTKAQSTIVLAVNERGTDRLGDQVDNWKKLSFDASYYDEPARNPKEFANKLEETVHSLGILRAAPIANELNARTCVVLWNPAEVAALAALEPETDATPEVDTDPESDTDPETLLAEMSKKSKK
jgi:hypothetical protein